MVEVKVSFDSVEEMQHVATCREHRLVVIEQLGGCFFRAHVELAHGAQDKQMRIAPQMAIVEPQVSVFSALYIVEEQPFGCIVLR